MKESEVVEKKLALSKQDPQIRQSIWAPIKRVY